MSGEAERPFLQRPQVNGKRLTSALILDIFAKQMQGCVSCVAPWVQKSCFPSEACAQTSRSQRKFEGGGTKVGGSRQGRKCHSAHSARAFFKNHAKFVSFNSADRNGKQDPSVKICLLL